MTATAALARAWVKGNDPAVFARIGDDGVDLAIWRRPPPPGLDGLGALDWGGIDDLAFAAEVAALDAEVADGLAQAGYPGGALGRDLAGEIAMLARRFAAALGCAAVRLRLEVVDTDACRRFHADFVPARLLATLWGPATQWVEAAAPDAVRQLAHGEVAIFRGRAADRSSAILHRSPPIAKAGDIRLLLAIDPAGGRAEPAAPHPRASASA